MDTSETYVKMAEKATEIQDVCPFREGDFIFNTSAVPNGHLFVNYQYQPRPDSPCYELIYPKSEQMPFDVWLPRQDQLQEMVISGQEVYMLLCDFGAWVDVFVRQPGDARDYASMEQLWLAFVMWTKYNKKWSGSDWTKIERGEHGHV